VAGTGCPADTPVYVGFRPELSGAATYESH
jgi:hypothetical protein